MEDTHSKVSVGRPPWHLIRRVTKLSCRPHSALLLAARELQSGRRQTKYF